MSKSDWKPLKGNVKSYIIRFSLFPFYLVFFMGWYAPICGAIRALGYIKDKALNVKYIGDEFNKWLIDKLNKIAPMRGGE